MSEFNFKSSICTSREQSERLLALGLKKETADMCWTEVGTKSRTYYVPELAPINMVSWMHTPAWSLHRLIEMRLAHDQFAVFQVNNTEDAFEKVISHIEHAIKEGYFNKDYLI